MEFLQEIGLFFFEALILVIAVLVVLTYAASLRSRRRGDDGGQVEIRRLNDRYKHYAEAIRDVIESPEATKQRVKAEKKAEKAERKAAKKAAKTSNSADSASDDQKPCLFVLDFDGDIHAHQADALREEVSAVLMVAKECDEVLLRLESGGGVVHGYGLAASQLQRIKDKGLALTVSVDKVAASGGYMMACVADKIVAAPFAILGSIGVVAQLPNFHRLLKKHDIDVELLTAGKYKRTLTMLGENTEEGRAKFVEDLEDTHALFKEFVQRHRSVVDVDTVATGEIWYGQRALGVSLADELMTSDCYLQQRLDTNEILQVRYTPHKSWQEKLGVAAASAFEATALRLWQRGSSRQLP